MQVTMHKHLGLTLDCRLSWALHTSAVIFKASQKIGLLCRLHHHLPPLVIQSMYVTCIRPAIEYASVAWSGVSTTDAERLERVQRSAARLPDCWCESGWSPSTGTSSCKGWIGLPPTAASVGLLCFWFLAFARFTPTCPFAPIYSLCALGCPSSCSLVPSRPSVIFCWDFPFAMPMHRIFSPLSFLRLSIFDQLCSTGQFVFPFCSEFIFVPLQSVAIMHCMTIS